METKPVGQVVWEYLTRNKSKDEDEDNLIIPAQQSGAEPPAIDTKYGYILTVGKLNEH
ncbi:hypothetical protein HDU78_002879, partial [Chytriomyces hyalinus]